MKTIGVVIVTYNSERHIESCLTSIQKQQYRASEVIVVDNHSSDGTLRILREKFPFVSVLMQEKNVGFARGVNRGIEECLRKNFDFIVLLNPDTMVESNFLESGVTFLQRNPTAWAVTPLIVYASHPDRIWFFGSTIWQGMDILRHKELKIGEHDFKGQTLTFQNNASRKTDWVTGCALFLPRSTVEIVGLFDESFFMYGEDVDFSFRIRRQGGRLWCFSDTVVYHDEPWKQQYLIFRIRTWRKGWWKLKARMTIVFRYFTFKEKMLYLLKCAVWPLRSVFALIY